MTSHAITEDAELRRKPVQAAIEGTTLRAGWWEIVAHVDLRMFDEGLMYSVVLTFSQTDDDGERGMYGKLETPFLWSASEAMRQAKRLGGLMLHSWCIDEEADEYVIETCEVQAEMLAAIILAACTRATGAIHEEARILAQGLTDELGEHGPTEPTPPPEVTP